MPESGINSSDRNLTIRHRSRIAQIGIFFRKFLRMFVYQSDWKVLPMAALIAGLVAFVLRRNFGSNMEGTLMGAFAIACVCIWNGSFNSIQVICRERDVIKREHRSGMHISSYMMAHMMYQLILCAIQTAVTLIVLTQMGMQFPGKGMFTPWMTVDAGISILLITYASDLLSLFISTLVHSTTTAMTIMPFVLIFQLLFSGCIFSLPKGVDAIKALTISSPGLKAVASQAKINDLPYSSVTDMLSMVDDVELGGYVTVGQVLDALEDTDNKTIADLRSIRIGDVTTVRDIGEKLLEEDTFRDIRETELIEKMTVGQAVEALLELEALDDVLSADVGFSTIGELADYLAADETVQSCRDEGITITATMGDILDLAGREEMKERLESRAAEAMYNPDYAFTQENVLKNWLHLLVFIVVFALLSTITLEFIDKDKR